MIRVGLYTRDFALKPLLASALGKEFDFLSESTDAGIQRMALDEHCDVVLLDLNSNHDGLKERIACATRLIEAQATVIVLADDVLRSTASDMVCQGAFGYCRRPPSIRELRLGSSPRPTNPSPSTAALMPPRNSPTRPWALMHPPPTVSP